MTINIMTLNQTMDPTSRFTLGTEPLFVEQPTILYEAPLPAGEANCGGFFLLCHEELLVSDKPEHYYHFAVKILDERGVQSFSNIQIEFDPSYQELHLHKIGVWRSGEYLSKNQLEQFQLLRREANLERFILDGRYTASAILDDVRIGDVLVYSYTIVGENPVFENKSSAIFLVHFGVPIKQMVYKVHTSLGRKVNHKVYGVEDCASTEDTADRQIITWRFSDLASTSLENGTPGWALQRGRIEVTEFNSWKEVASWATKNFLISDSESNSLQELVTQLTSTIPTKDAKITRLVDFVQEEVRYTGVEVGAYSHRPRRPDLVVSKRYGDCKEKSLLLCTLLNQIQVKAHVALVNTYLTRSISSLLPSPMAFNHAVVWFESEEPELIDPTLSGQKGKLAERWSPDYSCALILREGESDIKRITYKPQPCEIRRIDRFKVKSYKEPVAFSTSVTSNSWEADNLRMSLRTTKYDDFIKSDTEYYTSLYGPATPTSKLESSDDPLTNSVTMSSSFNLLDWVNHPDVRDQYVLDIFAYTVRNRLPLIHSTTRTLPLALTHPLEVLHEVELELPRRFAAKKELLEIKGKSFVYSREVISQGKVIRLKFLFKSLAEVIQPSDYPEERTKLEKAYALTGYRITKSRKDGLVWLSLIALGLYIVAVVARVLTSAK
jgi:Domain of Unknown Function with PDB structure (DUF3857)